MQDPLACPDSRLEKEEPPLFRRGRVFTELCETRLDMVIRVSQLCPVWCLLAADKPAVEFFVWARGVSVIESLETGTADSLKCGVIEPSADRVVWLAVR